MPANELSEYNESGFGLTVTIAPTLVMRLCFSPYTISSILPIRDFYECIVARAASHFRILRSDRSSSCNTVAIKSLTGDNYWLL
jgi:hypothetical protein